MKLFGILVTLTVTVASLVCARSASAADSASGAPPTVVPPGHNGHDLQHDLRGVPDNIKNLILSFDQNRDKYLQQQSLLLIKLRHAATPDEQDQIRQQLQANRQSFLTDLKGFREELRADLEALKGKISHAEFGRIIDAAHGASTDGGHRHRGQ